MAARRACRTDGNHKSIVEAFREAAMTVQDLSAVGNGCPDLAVGFRGVTCLVEVKDGSKVPSERKLTVAQQKWHSVWAGHVVIANSVDEAIRAVIDHVKETGRI